MPIPPTHCVMLRQSSSEGARSSGETVEAPVVVKPAMELKYASAGAMAPERTNGTEPTTATPTHPKTTTEKTSCVATYPVEPRARRKELPPRTTAPRAGSPKAATFPSATTREKPAEMSIVAPPAAITTPRALTITLGCKEAFYVVYGVLDGEDDRIVSGPEHLLAGGDNDFSASQERPN